MFNPWVVASTQDSRNLHPFFYPKRKKNKLPSFLYSSKPLILFLSILSISHSHSP